MPKNNSLSTTVRSKFHYVIWLVILFFIAVIMINVLLVTYLFNFNNNQADNQESETNQTEIVEMVEPKTNTTEASEEVTIDQPLPPNQEIPTVADDAGIR